MLLIEFPQIMKHANKRMQMDASKAGATDAGRYASVEISLIS